MMRSCPLLAITVPVLSLRENRRQMAGGAKCWKNIVFMVQQELTS